MDFRRTRQFDATTWSSIYRELNAKTAYVISDDGDDDKATTTEEFPTDV